MQIEANEEKMIKSFIDTMRTRDMRLPAEEVFEKTQIPKNVKLLGETLKELRMPLEFFYDAAMVYYDLKMHEESEKMFQETVNGPLGASGVDQKQIKIKILISLASFFLSRAIKENDQEMKDELLKKVRGNLTKSDRYNLNEKTSFVLKGFYFFYQNEIQQASDYFDNAKDTAENEYIPCLIGKGCIEYAKKNFQEALKLFKSCLRLNPNGSYKMRLALAYCYYQLDNLPFAKMAFESVLKREPNCIEALTGMSVIAKRESRFDDFYNLVCKIYEKEPSNPVNLIQLSEHYLYKNQFDNARKLAVIGITETRKLAYIVKDSKQQSKLKLDMKELESKFYYILGFITHSKGVDFKQAYIYYKKAVDLCPHIYQAQFGLGQIYVKNRDFKNAISCFETIVNNKTETESSDCFRIMAYCYSRVGKKQKSANYYELSIKYFPEDLELHIEYANYLESYQPKKALKIYKKVEELLEKRPDLKVKAEFYNNYSVTLIKNGLYDQSKSCIDKAFGLLATREDNKETLEHILKFNLGILCEKRCEFSKAYEIYEEMIKKNPVFTDPYLRQASINYEKGEIRKSLELCDKAIEATQKAPRLNRADIPYCLKGTILIQVNEYERAIECFNQLARFINFEDPYALLSICQVLYNKSVDMREVNIMDQKKYIKEAAGHCRRILKRREEENNMYAAMIIAVLFAERSNFKDASTILNSCQEAHPNNPQVLYNLAFLEYLNQNYEKSLTILASYNQKYGDEFNPQIEILFAINNFILKNFEDAYKGFQRMVRLHPENRGYLFNFAAFLHEYVKYSFKMTDRNASQTKRMIQYLAKSKNIFNKLDTRPSKSNPKNKAKTVLDFPSNWSEAKKKRVLARERLLSKKVEDNLFYINENHIQFQKFLKTDQEKHKKKDFSKYQRRQRVEFSRKQKIQKSEEEKLRKQREEEELEKRAKEEMLRAQDLAEKLKVANQPKPKRRRKNKHKELTEDKSGNMPLLNFNAGIDDDDEKVFEDIYSGGRMTLPEKAPKVVKPKLKKKRLKKKSETMKKKLDEDDEELDLDLNFGDDDDDKDGKDDKAMVVEQNGEEDEDGDINLDEVESEEEANKGEEAPQIVFEEGGDEGENTF